MQSKRMVRETLLDYFNTLTAIRGEFLVHDDGFRTRSYSYGDVVRAARNFAGQLDRAGAKPGSRILLWSENSPAWVAAFWGCVLRGVTVVPVDEAHSAAFAERVFQLVQPAAIAIGSSTTPPAFAGGTPLLHLSGIDWKTETEVAPASVNPDDAAEILFTSGATAEPKGVVITHRNILANIVPVERGVAQYRRWAIPFSPIRFLNLLPLSHMFGQAMTMFIPPMLAGTVILQRSQSPQDIVHQIRSRRISVLICVPKILDVLKDYVTGVEPQALAPPPASDKFWWRWWRYRRVHRLFGMKFWAFIVGGAALDPDLERFWTGLGWAVIQGYGLTEAAPIVTLNHPFHAKQGTVGKPIGGVEVRIAPDGEVLVRGGNVTKGYFANEAATREALEDGWFHTGDIGELDADGRLVIKGRKKEMIVLPDGRNVFPEDVEHVLNSVPGVKESAVVGLDSGSGERVHAVLVLEDGADERAVVREANAALEEHQRIRGCTVWPDESLPRTEGTRKLKRAAIRARLEGHAAPAESSETSPVEALLAKYKDGRVTGDTSLEELGLSSLDRVELMVALEQKLGAPVDEAAFAQARTVADIERLSASDSTAQRAEALPFPRWNRNWFAQAHRLAHLNTWVLALARLFAWVEVKGRENLDGIDGPVLFAANHQGYFDVPVLFLALKGGWRRRLAPTMRKEFFDAHFNPQNYSWTKVLTNRLNYFLACHIFNAVPIPQRDAGARDTLRFLGEISSRGECPLIFPEGRHSRDESIAEFQPGAAMIASRLGLPVVPVRIRGSNRVLHPSWKFPRPGRVRVAFGRPLAIEGDDFRALTHRLEDAVRSL
jgi:long-chain acyl-CoA synthetase